MRLLSLLLLPLTALTFTAANTAAAAAAALGPRDSFPAPSSITTPSATTTYLVDTTNPASSTTYTLPPIINATNVNATNITAPLYYPNFTNTTSPLAYANATLTPINSTSTITDPDSASVGTPTSTLLAGTVASVVPPSATATGGMSEYTGAAAERFRMAMGIHGSVAVVIFGGLWATV